MKLSFRIRQKDWLTDEAFENLLKSVKRNLHVIDEAMLFIGLFHGGYDPIPMYDEFSRVLEKRIATLKGLGIKTVGVNLWSSIGHYDAGWEWVEMPPFQTVVNYDGKTSMSCICMRDERFLDYIEEKYALTARAKPDYIYVDDDVRVHNHHVQFPCFCESCVQKFSKRAGRAFNRERLVSALEAPGSAALRRQFLEFNRDSLNELCVRIAAGCRRYDPEMRVGMMTTGMTGSCYAMSDQEGILKSLGATLARPGGGFYSDENPGDLINKLVEGSLQNAHMGDVKNIEWELEDFPVCWNKSAHVHVMEITGALMAGCTDITLNSILPYDYPYLMDGLYKGKAMWEKLAAFTPGTRMRGFCPVFVKDFYAAEYTGSSLFKHEAGSVYFSEASLTRLGLSWTCVEDDAEVYTISGDMMAAIHDEDIPKLFSRGVLMDTDALIILHKRGYGDLAGCRPAKGYESGLMERYLTHPINGEGSGATRDLFMNSHFKNGIIVRPLELEPGAEALSKLFSITGVDCGVGSCVYENRLGGRVAVCSYIPWRFLSSPGKGQNTPALVDYLAKGRFPITVSGGRKMFSMLRTRDEGDGFAAMLINASFDPTGELDVRIEGKCSKLTMYDAQCVPLDVEVTPVYEDGFTRLKLPAMGGWQFVLLIGE